MLPNSLFTGETFACSENVPHLSPDLFIAENSSDQLSNDEITNLLLGLSPAILNYTSQYTLTFIHLGVPSKFNHTVDPAVISTIVGTVVGEKIVFRVHPLSPDVYPVGPYSLFFTFTVLFDGDVFMKKNYTTGSFILQEPGGEQSDIYYNSNIIAILRSVIESKLTDRKDITSYSLGGRSISTMTLEELQKQLRIYEVRLSRLIRPRTFWEINRPTRLFRSWYGEEYP